MTLSRRESLQRLGLLSTATGFSFAYNFASAQDGAPFELPDIAPITAPGYGTDPDLIHPKTPWPLTLNDHETALLEVLVDLLIPATEDAPAASQVGVPAVIDEWVSAPYPDQQQHRVLILGGFRWLDARAQREHGQTFAALTKREQTAIIERIAYPERDYAPALTGPVQFFSLLRQLVAGAYYTTPEGMRAIGYMGNVPIAGDYPGPTDAAMRHLEAQLAELGLQLPSE